jgi:predicted negative regulator of RcsB-dependent stress response
VAEIRIEEKKRGAPWLLILLLLIVAAIIGWWLWSNRANGTETTGTPSGVVADSAAATRTP